MVLDLSMYSGLTKTLEAMSNLVTLRPGARGTIRLVQQYGERLVCVRYRYNQETRRRIKTVELIIDERAWRPKKPPQYANLIAGDVTALASSDAAEQQE